MRRIAMVGIGELALVDGPEPSAPRADEVTIAVEASGLGITQLHILSGRTHRRALPRVLGHEIVGRVIAAGATAHDRPIGSRVLVNCLIGCGRCRQCRAGQTSICTARRYLGMEEDGGWQERMTVPASEVFPILEGIPVTDALFLASAVPSAVHAVKRARVSAGDHVAVIGLGTIGTLIAQVARSVGAAQVVGVVSHERAIRTDGRPLDAVVPIGDDAAAAAARLRDACAVAGGFDVVLEASGDVRRVELALRAIRPGGSVLAMGLASGPQQIRFEDYNAEFALREVSLSTTYAFTRDDIAAAVAAYVRGGIRVADLSGGVVRPDDVPALVSRLESAGTGGKRYAISF